MPNAALDSAAPSLARPGADPIARSLRELRAFAGTLALLCGEGCLRHPDLATRQILKRWIPILQDVIERIEEAEYLAAAAAAGSARSRGGRGATRLPVQRIAGGAGKSVPPAAPRKIKGNLGPYQTSCTTFERGQRQILIQRVTPAGIIYRLKGIATEYVLPHEIAFTRAVSIAADANTLPRKGRIRRGAL